MEKSNLTLIIILFGGIIFSGCSFSTSSQQSSESSSSFSNSSSSEGGDSVQKTSNSYEEDVAALTILYVGSAGLSQDFQRELGQISESHGIVDWENNPGTYKAIGIGLKRAKISEVSIETLPLIQGMSSSPHYPQILDGYK